jgi:hypothetical protein
MAKKTNGKYDLKLIEALKKLQPLIEDKKHGFIIDVRDDQARSNETRFQHIAKKMHELKVRDIESIPEGIKDYIKFAKSKEIKDTYYYYIKRKGGDKGFIQVAILVDINDKKIAYLKTIFIAYRIKDC